MPSRRSSGSESKPSGPPLASSWAAPPEFYFDENLAGRTIPRFFRGLGYVVHTPPELYGTRELASGVPDVQWLADVGRQGWTALGRGTTILKTPDELAAYRAAKIHMVVYPGQAPLSELLEAMSDTLADVCTASSRARPGVWRVRRDHGRWILREL